MKCIFLISAILAMSPFAIADSDRILGCTGGGGGPGPASALVQISPLANKMFNVQIQYKNSNFPGGIKSEFKAKSDLPLRQISGVGLFLKIPVTFTLRPITDNKIHLSIYAQGNRAIEFGYGAHLSCSNLFFY